jgi:hypothetical protein
MRRRDLDALEHLEHRLTEICHLELVVAGAHALGSSAIHVAAEMISSTVVERPRWRMQVGLFQCARKVPICRRHAGGMIAERSASMMRLPSTPMGEPSRAACATWSLSFSAPTKAASSCPSGRRRRPAKNWRPSSHWWKNLFLFIIPVGVAIMRKKSPASIDPICQHFINCTSCVWF